jgi:hypothetical protein
MKRNQPVVCHDGFTMSVQAGEGFYCSSRFDGCDDGYTANATVEVGFPSKSESLLMDYYYADSDDPTNETLPGVYGYVPVGIVALVCLNHGGVVGGELPTEVWLSVIQLRDDWRDDYG